MNTLREAAALLYAELLIRMAELYGTCARLLTADERFLLEKADEILDQYFRRKMK